MQELDFTKAHHQIDGITPKFYVQDGGTDYDDGEEYNGLWPSFGNIGHWRLNETLGRVGFNSRQRGTRDILWSSIQHQEGPQGRFIQFRTPDQAPLENPSPLIYAMVGTGASYSETKEFNRFVKSNGLPAHSMHYFFNMRVKPDQAPSQGQRQTLLYLHHKDPDHSTHKVLRFAIINDGDLKFELAVVDKDFQQLIPVYSQSMADRFYQDSDNIQNLGFILRSAPPEFLTFMTDQNQVFKVQGESFLEEFQVINPDFDPDILPSVDFFLNGELYPAQDLALSEDWITGTISLNVNPIIGCEIPGDTPEFKARQTDSNQGLVFDHHFMGRIYSIAWDNAPVNVGAHRIQTLYNLGDDIPRGPHWVDLSDQYEVKGKNLLKEIGNIEQAIEDKNGNFYVTLNRVRAKNS